MVRNSSMNAGICTVRVVRASCSNRETRKPVVFMSPEKSRRNFAVISKSCNPNTPLSKTFHASPRGAKYLKPRADVFKVVSEVTVTQETKSH